MSDEIPRSRQARLAAEQALVRVVHHYGKKPSSSSSAPGRRTILPEPIRYAAELISVPRMLVRANLVFLSGRQVYCINNQLLSSAGLSASSSNRVLK